MDDIGSQGAFAYAGMLMDDLPAPAARWAGFPPYFFIGGNNDPTLIPTGALAEAAARVIEREGANLAIYNMGLGPQGFPGLRQFVSQKLQRRRAIDCTADDVLITTGSGQGIDLVCRMLAQPGDTILVEGFSYGGAITRFRKLGLKIVGMELDQDGIRMDALEASLADLAARGIKPRFIYTIPTIQNPTGSILPLDRRHRLLALAEQHGVPIFEDECYSDLLWGEEAPPALFALDPTRVIHIGSFSKSLAPALRVGYMVAEWSVLSRAIALKSDGGTGALDQMVIAEFFSEHYAAHIERLTTELEDKLDVMEEAVRREFGTSAEIFRPKGGIFLWLKLPDSVDVRGLLAPAAAAGLAFNPGPEWSCDADAAKSYLRLCFAMPSREVIEDGVRVLARVCFEQTGIPVFSGNRENLAG